MADLPNAGMGAARIVELMRAGAEDPAIQAAGASSLKGFLELSGEATFSAGDAPAVLAAGGGAALAAALVRHGGDAHVCEEAAAALAYLAMHGAAAKDALVAEGAVPPLVAALERHAGAKWAAIIRGALANIAQSESRRGVPDSGGAARKAACAEHLVAALRRNAEAASADAGAAAARDAAAAALCYTVYRCGEEAQRAFAAAGAGAALLAALERHAPSGGVDGVAHALGLVAAGSYEGQLACAGALVGVVGLAGGSPAVHRVAFDVLKAIARDEHSVAPFEAPRLGAFACSEAGALPAMVAALAREGEEWAGARESAAGALEGLTRHEALLGEACVGAVPALLAAAAAAGAAGHFACRALANIARGSAGRAAAVAAPAVAALLEHRLNARATGALAGIFCDCPVFARAAIAAGAPAALLRALEAAAHRDTTPRSDDLRALCRAVARTVEAGAPLGSPERDSRVAAFNAAGAAEALQALALHAGPENGNGDSDDDVLDPVSVLRATACLFSPLPHPRLGARLFLATLPPEERKARLSSCGECWQGGRKQCPRGSDGAAAVHSAPHVCPCCLETEDEGKKQPLSALTCGHLGHLRCLLKWAASKTAHVKGPLPVGLFVPCPECRSCASVVHGPDSPPEDGEVLVEKPPATPREGAEDQ